MEVLVLAVEEEVALVKIHEVLVDGDLVGCGAVRVVAHEAGLVPAGAL